MDHEYFDDLTRAIAAPVSRARMLKLLGGAFLSSALGGWGLLGWTDDAQAKKKKKKKKKHHRIPPPSLLGSPPPPPLPPPPVSPPPPPGTCDGTNCPPGYGCCAGGCTDLNTRRNCGSCDTICHSTASCVAGSCQCDAGDIPCGFQQGISGPGFCCPSDSTCCPSDGSRAPGCCPLGQICIGAGTSNPGCLPPQQ